MAQGIAEISNFAANLEQYHKFGNMNYFIIINDVQRGPFTVEELSLLGLQQDSLVWCEGMAQWTPAWQVEELKPLLFGTRQQEHPSVEPVAQPAPPPVPPRIPQEPQPAAANPQPPQKKGHRKLWIALIVLSVIVFLLALTNPGPAEHRNAIVDRIDTATDRIDNIDDPTIRGIVSGIMGLGNGMVKEVVRQLVDENLEYHNYIIFSTTTLHGDLLRHDIRTSVGCLGHVSAVSLSSIMPDIMMQQVDDGNGFYNGTTEETTTTVDSDGNQTTQTTKTTRRNGVTVDSLTKRVTSRIADEVANKVKREVRQQVDSSTASGVEQLVNDVLNLIKGL